MRKIKLQKNMEMEGMTCTISAERRNAVIGIIDVVRCNEKWQITMFSVDLQWRRKGIGKLLMGELTNLAIENNIRAIIVYPRVEDGKNISREELHTIYQKLGFVNTGLRFQDMVLFEKKISLE